MEEVEKDLKEQEMSDIDLEEIDRGMEEQERNADMVYEEFDNTLLNCDFEVGNGLRVGKTSTMPTPENSPDKNTQECTGRIQAALLSLEKKWSDTPYTVILKKCSRISLWESKHEDVGETFLFWLLEHDPEVLVEEGMDIMEGLEGIWTEKENVGMLRDSIDIITSVVVIWKTLSGCLDVDGEERSMPE